MATTPKTEAEATRAAREMNNCLNTVAALELAYTMLRCTHASEYCLRVMEEAVGLAREELGLRL
jgi:hypothetical protein